MTKDEREMIVIYLRRITLDAQKYQAELAYTLDRIREVIGVPKDEKKKEQ